jgi:hypothetical protein
MVEQVTQLLLLQVLLQLQTQVQAVVVADTQIVLNHLALVVQV